MMVHRLGCEMNDVVAAIAPVAGALEIDCAPAGPVSAIVFHGRSPIVPYAGGPAETVPRGMDGDYDPVSTGVDVWATTAGCNAAKDEPVSASVARQVRTGCVAGYGVELIPWRVAATPGPAASWGGPGDVPRPRSRPRT